MAEIASGIDAKIDAVLNTGASASQWADRNESVLQALKSANNDLGTAALVDTGTANGNVPVIASGKIATSLIDTATAGGAASASKIVQLTTTGLIASSMLPSASAGIKWIWKYDSTGPGGETPTSDSANRQFTYTWRPRSRQGQSDTYVNCTAILVFVTGGGGSGAYGPDSSVTNGNPGGGSIAGHAARKGGGGGAGGTAIRMITGINADSTYEVKVGWGGALRPYGQNSGSTYGGADSRFGNDIEGGGGEPGKATGNGGVSTGGGFGDNYLGFYLYGGAGHDGTFDRLGAGSGGASFWGGGYSGGGGREGTQTAAPGAGGGAANGSAGVAPYGFTARANGHRGNDGVVLILGF